MSKFLQLGEKYGTTSGVLIYVGRNIVRMGETKHITHYFAAPAILKGVIEDRLHGFLLAWPEHRQAEGGSNESRA